MSLNKRKDDKSFDYSTYFQILKNKKTMIKCANCGNSTTNPRFCSRTCAAILTNKEKPKRQLTKKCKQCENTVRNYRSILCEQHFQIYKQRFVTDFTIKDYQERRSVEGKPAAWINSHIRLFARRWLKHMVNLPCACCGYDKHVELAHIKSVSSFDVNTLVSVVNAEENVIQLCPNCHWEFDNLPREGKFIELLKALSKNLS